MLLEGYPGVYIQEVPSGVRTITGASTAILAIAGHFPRGPVDRPVRVTSWSDVERNFGGIDRRYEAAYALQEFFLQGGTQAWVARIAFRDAGIVLTTTETAMTVRARATGTGGNAIEVRITHTNGGNFNLQVRDGNAGPFTEYNDLSTDPLSSRFAGLIVNAAVAAGGSPLIQLEGIAQLPAATGNTSVTLQNGAVGVAASAPLTSVPLPALTLQALSGASNSTTVQVTAGTAANTFRLVFANPARDLDNLVLNPTSADYVVSRVNGTGVVAVVEGQHPLRVPAVAAAASFTGGGTAVPSASTAIPRASGNGNAMTVTAVNPGSWGNALRIGIMPTLSGGFDMSVSEYRGAERVRGELFRNLNVIPNDPNNVVAVVARQSELVRVSNAVVLPRASSNAAIDIENVPLPALYALTGGTDGTLPGDPAWAAAASAAFLGSEANRTGLFAFSQLEPDYFTLMAIPEAPYMADGGNGVYAAAGAFCRDQLAFLLVDHPVAADSVTGITGWPIAQTLGTDLARSAALCFPKVVKSDPLGGERTLSSSGSIAGLMARTDAQRGVWKAPAGLDASLSGVRPSVPMTDRQQAQLNKRGLNVIRVKPFAGSVNWGARTLAGADALASEWKYVPVRRTALMIERTLKDSLPWVVFEPNDESLWAQIRLNIGAFMQSLFVQGAFQGSSPREAYLVKCDRETTSQQDVNSGIVNILVGFAPLKPAEFVVVRLTQLAGRLAA
ncbi:phage tail sheath C-terminal domain-containing protein [Erythrobacter colymbi]|uniref:phage tail sheath C-terminal domain-containing protein n=1 Tax=Erythrobacter colymbi TaxID=1161202 RepID=UPI000A3939C7|nr:phage tail sheath C-terminal domain-containing protein [Erythrobacter colymbi]